MANNRPEMNSMHRDALRRTREMYRQDINKNNVQAQAQRQPRSMASADIPPLVPADIPPLASVDIPPLQKAPEPEKVFEPDPKGKANQKQDTSSANPKKKNNGILGGLLSGIFPDGNLDKDKIIIIALIVILAKEGVDLKLLLALGYILM